ncbi:chaperonin 10-like protein [Microdochium trichocladiopsis]|uniref:Chaperonin 10-like protein n=1 Tax=Microdochium trichocladiopsis TaxID=1682393 RepID=A0A9P8YJ03_9PEZI|nr:chaperonin 10-like protein [Microdochium trichocladiopsis]KAH7040246.1 chaperonin 10-like protein [Microdochium trichocladiopsis]
MPSFTVFKGSKDGVVVKGTTTKPDELTGDHVLIKVTASGVCGTDLHYTGEDMVLGHEGVGVIEKVGPACKTLKVGDRVGWGYQTGSCQHCASCLTGEETFCNGRVLYAYANRDQGSFSYQAVWSESFLHRIPDGLSDEDAAPLQCAGATVYTPLYDVRPNEVVGIMGVGGLGHLAIQFAAKMGCRVVVISGSDSKKEEALRLGAHRFITMKEAEQAAKSADWWPIKRLLVTTSAQPKWDVLLPLLAMRANVYPLSVSAGNFEIPYMPLLAQGLNVVGSLVATRVMHREMLSFAAVHGVKPVIETFPMTEEGVNDAIKKLNDGKVHFRAVLIPPQ